MNKDYINGFLQSLLELKLGNTPQAISPGMLEVYSIALEDIEPKFIAMAYRHIVKNGTASGFWPSGPELRKLAKSFENPGALEKLDLAWKAFKNYVPNLIGEPAEEQQKRINADPALKRCIEAFHQDWSLSSPDSGSYWFKIFSEAYTAIHSGQSLAETQNLIAQAKQRAVVEEGFAKVGDIPFTVENSA